MLTLGLEADLVRGDVEPRGSPHDHLQMIAVHLDPFDQLVDEGSSARRLLSVSPLHATRIRSDEAIVDRVVARCAQVRCDRPLGSRDRCCSLAGHRSLTGYS
jgi:hypothetical protein